MYSASYREQMTLLVRCLPEVFKQDCFALKGGTAINLFVRDLPRLSVDIDLTYMPIQPRNESLQSISDALTSMQADIQASLGGGCSITPHHREEFVIKLTVRAGQAVVKIEPSTVLRGSVHPPETRDLVETAQQELLAFASAPVLSEADLYGGKLCAALDRQHPRDLFDVRLLLDDQGITEEIRQSFVVYLASHNRPMNELLNPSALDIEDLYRREFEGMTRDASRLDDLLAVQAQLPALLRRALTEPERAFLLSIKRGEPDWELLGIAHLAELPGLQWKLHNIRKMSDQKRSKELERLQRVLAM